MHGEGLSVDYYVKKGCDNCPAAANADQVDPGAGRNLRRREYVHLLAVCIPNQKECFSRSSLYCKHFGCQSGLVAVVVQGNDDVTVIRQLNR